MNRTKVEDKGKALGPCRDREGRGQEDADALMADIVLACIALNHVAEFAVDKCRIIPVSEV